MRWPMNWSERISTGVWYSSAMLKASTVTQKQSATSVVHTTTFEASPCVPKMPCIRSPCSVLVGMPVDGPTRCTFRMTIGISAIDASPIASSLSEMPGPEDAVSDFTPA